MMEPGHDVVLQAHLYNGDLGLQGWRQLTIRAQQVEHGALVQLLHALLSCTCSAPSGGSWADRHAYFLARMSCSLQVAAT